MSTRAQVKTQAKAPAAPAAARIPQPPVAELEHEAERPDITAQLEGAARLGHSLGAVGVASPALPIIERQELPEEEEEELQMKREPAALQRQELPEEEEELMLKRDEQRIGLEGGPVSPEIESAITRARGGGQPMEDGLQEQMSEALGHDFSEVRVHADSEADDLNQQLQAKAFTTGPDIFFRQGEYNPGSGSGRELIGHELTHVVQQRTGRVGAESSGMAVRPVGGAFEQEADDVGRKANREPKNRSRQRPTSKPGWPSPADIGTLQNTICNRAVTRPPVSRQGKGKGLDQEEGQKVGRGLGEGSPVRLHADQRADSRLLRDNRKEDSDFSSDAIPEISRLAGQTQVQRKIVVGKGKIMAQQYRMGKEVIDATELTTIAFALSRAGEIGEASANIEFLPEADFSNLKPGEVIYVVGHGAKGNIGALPAETVARILTSPEKGVPPTLKEVKIMVFSCHAGEEVGEIETSPDSSAVAKLSAELGGKRPETLWYVVGGAQATIKGTMLGERMFVRQGDSTVEIDKQVEAQIPKQSCVDAFQKEIDNYKRQRKSEPPLALKAIWATRAYWERALLRTSLLQQAGLITAQEGELHKDIVVYMNGVKLEKEERLQIINEMLATTKTRRHELILPKGRGEHPPGPEEKG